MQDDTYTVCSDANVPSKKQARQCKNNVTLRRVRVTIAATEK